MTVKEVAVLDTGDLLINVEATRGGITYKLPYQIPKRKITEIDPEYLKKKVRLDIDEREAATAREDAVIGKLRALQGQTVKI